MSETTAIREEKKGSWWDGRKGRIHAKRGAKLGGVRKRKQKSKREDYESS